MVNWNWYHLQMNLKINKIFRGSKWLKHMKMVVEHKNCSCKNQFHWSGNLILPLFRKKIIVSKYYEIFVLMWTKICCKFFFIYSRSIVQMKQNLSEEQQLSGNKIKAEFQNNEKNQILTYFFKKLSVKNHIDVRSNLPRICAIQN